MFEEMASRRETRVGGVLHIMVSHLVYPVTEKVLRQVFDAYGIENMEVSQHTNHVEAWVQLGWRYQAQRAREDLHGRAIYDGCCFLAVQDVSPTSLAANATNYHDRAMSLLELKQTGTVAEYTTTFWEGVNRVLDLNPKLSIQSFVHDYVDGLRADIQPSVRSQSPSSISRASSLARIREAEIAAMECKANGDLAGDYLAPSAQSVTPMMTTGSDVAAPRTASIISAPVVFDTITLKAETCSSAAPVSVGIVDAPTVFKGMPAPVECKHMSKSAHQRMVKWVSAVRITRRRVRWFWKRSIPEVSVVPSMDMRSLLQLTQPSMVVSALARPPEQVFYHTPCHQCFVFEDVLPQNQSSLNPDNIGKTAECLVLEFFPSRQINGFSLGSTLAQSGYLLQCSWTDQLSVPWDPGALIFNWKCEYLQQYSSSDQASCLECTSAGDNTVTMGWKAPCLLSGMLVAVACRQSGGICYFFRISDQEEKLNSISAMDLQVIQLGYLELIPWAYSILHFIKSCSSSLVMQKFGTKERLHSWPPPPDGTGYGGIFQHNIAAMLGYPHYLVPIVSASALITAYKMVTACCWLLQVDAWTYGVSFLSVEPFAIFWTVHFSVPWDPGVMASNWKVIFVHSLDNLKLLTCAPSILDNMPPWRRGGFSPGNTFCSYLVRCYLCDTWASRLFFTRRRFILWNLGIQDFIHMRWFSLACPDAFHAVQQLSDSELLVLILVRQYKAQLIGVSNDMPCWGRHALIPWICHTVSLILERIDMSDNICRFSAVIKYISEEAGCSLRLWDPGIAHVHFLERMWRIIVPTATCYICNQLFVAYHELENGQYSHTHRLLLLLSSLLLSAVTEHFYELQPIVHTAQALCASQEQRPATWLQYTQLCTFHAHENWFLLQRFYVLSLVGFELDNYLVLLAVCLPSYDGMEIFSKQTVLLMLQLLQPSELDYIKLKLQGSQKHARIYRSWDIPLVLNRELLNLIPCPCVNLGAQLSCSDQVTHWLLSDEQLASSVIFMVCTYPLSLSWKILVTTVLLSTEPSSRSICCSILALHYYAISQIIDNMNLLKTWDPGGGILKLVLALPLAWEACMVLKDHLPMCQDTSWWCSATGFMDWCVALEAKHNLEGREVSCPGSMTRKCVGSVCKMWGPKGSVSHVSLKRPTPCTESDMEEMYEV